MFTEYKRTYISRKNIKILTRKNLSARKMVAYMEDGIRYRSFQDILEEYCGKKDLIEKLCASSGQSRDTVRKRVYQWSKGIFSPRRDEIFQICFVLGLSIEQADKLLLSISETGIHYRNPRELIYVYGLQHGMNWQEVTDLQEDLLEKYEKIEREVKQPSDDEEPVLTRHMEINFHESVHSQEDLEKFLMGRVSDLGKIRKTVYKDFVKMMNLLQRGEKDAKKLSVEELTDTYIQNLPKKSSYDYLIKIIEKNWPSKDKLYKMLQGHKNVNRKTMLLLLLITEEFMGEELSSDHRFAYYDETENLTPNEILQIRIKALNLYLDSYGMNRLDLGNPFDCMVLYALKASYEEAMSDRLQEILRILFQEK